MTIRRPLIFLSAGVFFALAGIGYLLTDKDDVSKKIGERISSRLERERQLAHRESESFFANGIISDNLRNYFYILEGGEITRWSTQSFVPDGGFITNAPFQFLKTSRGEYFIESRIVGPSRHVSVIPLREKFRITNNYLEPTFNSNIFDKPVVDIVEPEGGAGIAIYLGEHHVFNIVPLVQESRFDFYSGVLLSLSILCLSVSLAFFVYAYTSERKFEKAFAILLIGGGLLRVAMIGGNFPTGWIGGAVFDPLVFASSSFNSSLGDLVFNASYVFVVCLYLFQYFFRFGLIKKITSQRGIFRKSLTLFFLLLSFFGFLFPFLFFETIANNSDIELDWTRSLVFDAARITALISILIGLISSFLFCHVFLKLAIHLVGPRQGFVFLCYVMAAAILLGVYSFLLERDYFITMLTGSALFGLIYFGSWDKSLERITFLTFIYLLAVISFQSIQSALAIRKLESARSTEAMRRFGASLVGRDVLGEFLLNEAAGRIAGDPFIQARMGNPLFGRGSIRQKIRLVYLNAYFDRYETEVHLFSPAGEPLDAQSQIDFASFIDRYHQDAGATGYRGIYVVDPVRTDFTKKYVTIIPVSRGNRSIGFIAIAMTQKRIAPRNVYPQLLVDNRFAHDTHTAEYSYSVLQNDSLLSRSGDVEDHTPDGKQRDRQRIVVEGDNGLKAEVVGDRYSFFNLIANLSFWILAGVTLVVTWLLLRGVENIRTPLRLTYSARIQLYVYLSFLIPLLTITITTLNWTSRSAEQQLEVDFTARAKVLEEQIAPVLFAYRNDSSDLNEFENYFSEAARLAGLDATIYTTNGKLLATNQPLIFDNQILSKWINPKVKVNDNPSTPLVIEERVGKLKYNSVYYALRSPQTAEVLGILGIPFFESAFSLEREQIAILSNVSVIFVITLLLFTLFSFVAVRWLTFPLQMITRSLRSTSLKGTNRLLEWNANDEIGLMVQEYNRMVSNLEKSRVELARSQKESAWREMAQQVAHEIKNPLTPMKLTLQQMEWAMRKKELSIEKTEKSVESLLTQLEILNDIASSFSSFAKMPAPNLERVELGPLLKNVADLYLNHPLGVVGYSIQQPTAVLGDEQLLTRIFSNLILNALQSGEEGEKVHVSLRMERAGHLVKIYFEDDGRGIDDSLRDKVFMPHFTTKKSGSGLGLAICKQGVEQCGGTISFETNFPRGTVFIVAFPVV